MLEADHTGVVLDGRYRVQARRGQGGMGTVYVAEHVGLAQPRAIKFLRADLARKPGAVQRFLQEARVLSAMRHDNLVGVIDMGEHAGSAYYVMELLEGEDLRGRLRRVGGLGWPQTRAIALQVCAALQLTHARGVVHRDLKPENCFCVDAADDAVHIKLIDFGVAKVPREAGGASQLTGAGELLGTIGYMAPEQLEGHSDRRVDVYSLGAMMFEMLAGRPLHTGNAYEILARMLLAPAPALASVCAVDPAIDRLLATAVARDPGDRFTSMEAFAAANAAIPASATPQTFHRPASAPAPARPEGETTAGGRAPAAASVTAVPVPEDMSGPPGGSPSPRGAHVLAGSSPATRDVPVPADISLSRAPASADSPPSTRDAPVPADRSPETRGAPVPTDISRSGAPVPADRSWSGTPTPADSRVAGAAALADGYAATLDAPVPTDSHAATLDAPVPMDSHAAILDAPVPMDSHAATLDAPIPTDSHAATLDAPVPTDSHAATRLPPPPVSANGPPATSDAPVPTPRAPAPPRSRAALGLAAAVLGAVIFVQVWPAAEPPAPPPSRPVPTASPPTAPPVPGNTPRTAPPVPTASPLVTPPVPEDSPLGARPAPSGSPDPSPALPATDPDSPAPSRPAPARPPRDATTPPIKKPGAPVRPLTREALRGRLERELAACGSPYVAEEITVRVTPGEPGELARLAAIADNQLAPGTVDCLARVLAGLAEGVDAARTFDVSLTLPRRGGG